jgi:hypothetical protein
VTISAAGSTSDGSPEANFEIEARVQSWEVIGLAVGIAAYLLVCLLLIREGVPLGHDEAVYATRARELLLGQPASGWWGVYRAPGLPVFLTLAWIGTGTESHLRLVVVIFGGALIVFTWLLGRVIIGRRGSLVAAFGIALTPVILSSSTQVWPDIPAAAVGMVALYIYARGLGLEAIPWWIVVAVPLLVAVSTAIRYGAPISLAIGLAGLTIWRLPVGLGSWLRVAVTAAGVGAAVFFTLMTPVFTGATTPFSALVGLSEGVPISQGFEDYWRLRSSLILGTVVPGVLGVLAGIIGSLLDPEIRRRVLWPLGIGIVTFVVLSASVHGEARYLAAVYPWFWLAAGIGLSTLGRFGPKRLAVGMASLAIMIYGALALQLSDDRNRFNEGFTALRLAASSLDTGENCGVLTSYTPQVEWYSGCETIGIDRTSVVTDSPLLPEGPRFLLIVEGGKRQPAADLLERYLLVTTGEVSTFGRAGQPGSIRVWTLADD